MIPVEQKAKELIKKFEPHINWEDHDETGKRIDHAKFCAIICLDEIINEVEKIDIQSAKTVHHINTFQMVLYWNAIKDYIINL